MYPLPSKDLLSQQLKVNVRDFGAMGDGSNDDWRAIQDAIDYAQHKGSLAYIQDDGNGSVDLSSIAYPASRNLYCTQGGATVYFPSGTYKISRPLILPATGGNTTVSIKGFSVQLEGENATSTVIRGAPDFCMNHADIDPMEVRALVEWDPQYNFSALEALGYSNLMSTTKVDQQAWQNSRKVRELMALDEYAEALIDQIFNVPVETGAPRLQYCLDLYSNAVTDIARQVTITGSPDPKDPTKDILKASNNGFMFNRSTNQRISNLTFYMPERPRIDANTPQRYCAIGRRWPWMITRPRLFELLEQWITQGAQGAHQWFPGNEELENMKAIWVDDTRIYYLLNQSCMESSRLQVKIENVDFMGGNNVHCPAYCQFEGSVINSEINTIRARVTDEISNVNAPKVLARSRHHDTTEFSSWLFNAGILEDLDTPTHDTILFEFDEGRPRDYGADKVGYQFSQVESIWAYGKQFCVFKGRINAVNWNFAFSDGSLFGPSYHFTNSSNSYFQNLHHEGGHDRHVFLLEHCLGLKFNGFGTGGQRLWTGSTAWPPFMRKRCRTLSSVIKLSECIACRFDGRQGITPMYASSMYEILLRAQAHNQAATSPDDEYIISNPPPAFIEIDDKSYRNQITNFELTFVQTSAINSLDYTAHDKDDKEKTQPVLNWIRDWLNEHPENTIDDFLHTEFVIHGSEHSGLNQVSGWLYLHEYYQTILNSQTENPDFYRFTGSNQHPSYSGSAEWGGIPFSVGRSVDDPANHSHKNWS